MTLKFHCLYSILIALLLLQCTAPQKVIVRNDSHLIKNLVIFPVYSKIDVIENRDKRITSEFFSSNAAVEIKNKLEKYIPSNINKSFFVCNDQLEEEIIKSNLQLIKTVKGSAFANKTQVPKFLLKLLDSLEENYALFIYQFGFTRTPENLQTQYIKRKTAGIASLGLYDTEPNSSYSVMIGVLVDKSRKRLSMYKELYWRNRNPNEEVVIRSQVRDMILGYFEIAN